QRTAIAAPWLSCAWPTTWPRSLTAAALLIGMPGTWSLVITPFCHRKALSTPASSTSVPATWPALLTAQAELRTTPGVEPRPVRTYDGNQRLSSASRAGRAEAGRLRRVTGRPRQRFCKRQFHNMTESPLEETVCVRVTVPDPRRADRAQGDAEPAGSR